ncbi:MAG: SAP domain-containing protein, partial [Treponema sp.]|nr:SAP domain-containing protein [Treponema sp.]
METRPDFAAIKSFAEFSRYYWYREELKLICKTLGIDASGMKAELVRRIEAYFAGNKILPQAPCRRPRCAPAHVSTDTLSLQTGLIACGFRFSKRFRDFFAAQTGVKNFKFNVNMVASAKKVK